MVKAIVDINKRANQILNVVKAKEDLKDKSEAINLVVTIYGEELLEPELRPEFIHKMRIVAKEKTIKVKNVDKYFREL